MNKIILLLLSISLLFAVGCGSGGGSTAQGTLPDTSGGTSPTVNGTGIAVNIPAETHAANTIHVAAALPVTSNWARMVATKSTAAGAPCYAYDGSTDSYIQTSPTGCSANLDRRVKDCDLSVSTSCFIAVTPTSGDESYKVDVITYYKDIHGLPNSTDSNIDYNIITRYATGSSILVTQGQSNTATVTWATLGQTLNIPNPMERTTSYSLAPVAYPAPLFAGKSYVRYSATAITNTFPYTPVPTNPISLTTKFTAPDAASTYLQGQFFIDPNYLQAGEGYQNWVYYDNTNASTPITLTNPTTLNITVP